MARLGLRQAVQSALRGAGTRSLCAQTFLQAAYDSLEKGFLLKRKFVDSTSMTVLPGANMLMIERHLEKTCPQGY